jgi:putative SbcD/Mre11-related phosphoesterase
VLPEPLTLPTLCARLGKTHARLGGGGFMRIFIDWLLTPERAAVYVPTATGVIADLHLGYNQVRCGHGEAIPDFDLEAALEPLQSLARRLGVRRLVIAGDLFEDGRYPGHAALFLQYLDRAGIELAGVIPGNHDRSLAGGDSHWPIYPNGMDVGGWQVLHGNSTLPRGRVIHGHVHPCLRCQRRAPAPCFLVGTRRIILPAFSPDAAGVNVLSTAAWKSYRCYVPAGKEVLDFGSVGSLARRLQKGRSVIR